MSDSFGYILLNDIAPNLDKSSEYDLKNFPNVSEAFYICNLLSIVMKWFEDF